MRSFQQALRAVFVIKEGVNTFSRKLTYMKDKYEGVFKNPFLRGLVVNGPQLAIWFKLSNPKAAIAALAANEDLSVGSDSSENALDWSGDDERNELNLAFKEKVDTIDFYECSKRRHLPPEDIRNTSVNFFKSHYRSETPSVVNTNLINIFRIA